MKLLKTIFVFTFTCLFIVIFFPAGFVAFCLTIIGFKKTMRIVIYRIAQCWARLVIFLTGCPMNISGRENIPKKGGVCFVSNHVGILDILLTLSYTGRPFGFIAKKELLLIPGINIWIFMLGGLFLDRKKPKRAVRTINLGIDRLKAGESMLIFPEGTRSRGRGIAPFHPGSLKLATQSGSLIVPVAITGSYDVFEKAYRVCAVPVYVSFLPAIDPSTLPFGERKKILADQVHAVIEAELRNHGAGD